MQCGNSRLCKARAREMEAALRAPAATAPVAGRKRSWAGLNWEGADDGGLRRGRSRVAAATVVGGAAEDTRPAAAVPLAVATATPLVGCGGGW